MRQRHTSRLTTPRSGSLVTQRRGRLLVAAALVVSLGLGGCSGDDEASPPDGSDPQELEDGTRIDEAPVLSPLTGLELPGKAPRHPVVAVKIDNSAAAAPQVGLGSADMVVEELVEGGITRLATFFYSTIPGNVGPVRSMRATDIGIVTPLDAVLVASGGARPTVERVRAARIRTFTEGATGFYRDDNGRYAPYNLFMRLDDLVATLRPPAQEPQAYLPFGTTADLPRGRPARRLTATFSTASATSFEFRGGRYVNTDTNAAAGDQFQPKSVLVLRVPIGDAGYLDPSGAPVPETKLTGSGPAFLFHGGRLVRGTWTKDGLAGQLRLASGGGELTVPKGKVWVELVPNDRGGVTFGR